MKERERQSIVERAMGLFLSESDEHANIHVLIAEQPLQNVVEASPFLPLNGTHT